MTQMLLHY